MTNKKTLSLLNLISFIIMLGVNALATFNFLGASTKELSDANPSLLMPIGLTFSIVWTLIYVLLIIYVIKQLIKRDDPFVKDISYLFLMSNIFNTLWILSYHAKLQLISNVVIIALLVTLFMIVRKTSSTSFITKMTFSIYYGWISVATLVSIFSYISSFNPDNFDSTLMRVLVGVAAVILFIMTLVRNKDYPYIATIVFSMFGILFKHILDFNGKYPEIIVILLIGIIMTLVICIASIINKDGIFEDDDYVNEGGAY